MKNLKLALLIPAMIACQPKNQSANTASHEAVDTINREIQIKYPDLIADVIELSEEDFGEVIELTGEPVETNALFKPSELNMFVEGNQLVMNGGQSPGLIKILSLPDLQLVDEFGVKGEGPGELMWPTIFPSDEPDVIGYIYDMMSQNLFSFNHLHEILELSFDLPKEDNLFGSKQFFEFEKQQFYYVSNSTTGKGVYKYLPTQGDSVSLVFDLEDGFKSNLGWSGLIGDFGGNRDKHRMAFAYKYFHQVRFFDYENNTTRTLKIKAPKNYNTSSKDALTVMAPTNPTHYWGMSPQKDHVYCLYSGRAPVDVGKQLNEGTDYIYVEQFTWNGDPVAKYRLDQWGYFCVDEANHTIYIAAVNDEYPFYRYDYTPKKN